MNDPADFKPSDYWRAQAALEAIQQRLDGPAFGLRGDIRAILATHTGHGLNAKVEE